MIKLLVMFLIMSMNAWVCGAMILGMTLGQVGFEHLARVKKWRKVGKDQSILSEEIG